MATITIELSVDWSEARAIYPSTIATQLAAIDIGSNDTLELLEYTLDADNTAVVGSMVTRTIELGTTADSDYLFPTDEAKIASVTKVFKGVLNLGLPGIVVEDSVTVTP